MPACDGSKPAATGRKKSSESSAKKPPTIRWASLCSLGTKASSSAPASGERTMRVSQGMEALMGSPRRGQ